MSLFNHRLGWLRSTLLLPFFCIGASACQGQTDPEAYWTNFEWAPHEEGMLVLSDSVVLPYKPGYEAVVRQDSSYFYLKNISEVGHYVYVFPNGNEGPTVGNFAYNEDGLFSYGNNWRDDESRWQIYVRGTEREPGVQRQIQGDCIGFDGEHLYVRNAVPVEMRRHRWTYGQIGEILEVYDYDLTPDATAEAPECTIYAP